MSSKSRIPIFGKKSPKLSKTACVVSKAAIKQYTEIKSDLPKESSKTEYQYSKTSFIQKGEAVKRTIEVKSQNSIKEKKSLPILNLKSIKPYLTNTSITDRNDGDSSLEYPRPQRFEDSFNNINKIQTSSNNKNYEILRNSINTFKNKFTDDVNTIASQSNHSLRNDMERVDETSSSSYDEYIYDNCFIDCEYFDDDENDSDNSNDSSDKTETIRYSIGSIDDTFEAIIDDNETNLSTDFIDNDNKVDLSISKNENNTQLHDTKNDFLINSETCRPFYISSNSVIEESTDHIYSTSNLSLNFKPNNPAKSIFKTRSFNDSTAKIAFLRNFKKRNSLYSLDKFLNLETEPFITYQEKMLSLKPSGGVIVNRGIIKKSCSSGEIHGKTNADYLKQNNNLIINVRKAKPFDNQETIIEECKNSLNELIKASKWPGKSNSSISNNLDSFDSLHLDQIPALNLSQSSLATSSLSSNFNDQTFNKSSGLIQMFDNHPKKIFNTAESVFASPTSTKCTVSEVEKNKSNKRVCNDYDTYEVFVQSNDALANDSEVICSPASNLVGGASQFNSKLFQLKKSQSAMTDNLNSLNLIINDEVSTTEDLNCHQTSSNEEPTKKSSYIKNNNSSSKFYTRSTSVNNLKYSNFQSLANRAAAAKNQSNKNQFSSVQFNQIFDEHNTSPAAGTSLSSSSSDAIVSNLSISSLASPNQKNEPVDQSYKSGSSKLIIKKKKANKKCSASTNTVEQQGALDQIDENQCKRFSTHSEILAASNTNNLLDKDSYTKTLPHKLQRRSTPSAAIKSTDSLNSFQSIASSSVNSSISVSTNPNMNFNSKFPSTCGVFSPNPDSRPPAMTRSKSRKSLSSKPEHTQKNSSQNFLDEDYLEPTNHLNNRKQNNSWIAQSFRKAFFGNQSKKNKQPNTHKSHIQINNTNSSNNNNSTNSSNNRQGNSKMTSSISVHNCTLASYDSKFQRNSCSDNSKRSSLSDDEQDECNSLNRRVNHSIKLSLPPNTTNNDSDSEYEEKYSKNVQSHSSALVHKRSYRSESELANKLQIAPSLTSNQISVINYNESENVTTRKTIQQQPQHKLSTPQQHQQYGSSYLKLSSTHKSVTSLLTTSNTNSSNTDAKLHEINQPYSFNRMHDGSNLNLMAMNENQTNRVQKKICNCKINETIITDLKKKLTLAENKLTDIRLEALSSVHQVDQLKDFLEKMKNEIVSLKSENQALKSYIKEGQTMNISTRKGLNDSDSTNFAFIDEYYLNSKNNNSSKINQIFQALNANLNTYYYSYNFLLGDENESLLRKTLVTVECSYQLKLDKPEPEQTSSITGGLSSLGNRSEFFAYEICTINLDSKLKWDLMDGIISYVFKRYINKIDPAKKLGLDKDSIDKYYIGEIVRRINDTNYPVMLPFGYLVGSTCTIRIILKDNYKSLDSLSYETLMPKYQLEDYVSLLENNRLIGINSLQKFGKTYLMRKLGQFISKNNEKDIEMIYYNMEDILNANQKTMHTRGDEQIRSDTEYFLEIKQKLLINIEMKLRALDTEKSVMILLDNFHVLFLNNSDLCSRVPVDIVQSILKLIQRSKLYLVVTTQESSTMEAGLNCLFEFNQNFKWINLCGDQVSFLQSYLNRNLIHYQMEQQKLKDSCVIMEKVVHFVIDVFKLVNELITRLGCAAEATNLMNFMNLPFGVEVSEKWFIELWNYSIIPHLNDVVKMKLITNNKHRFNIKQTDPTEWIINNYVWPRTEVNVNIQQRLLNVKYLNEITANRISSSSDDSEFNPNSRSLNKNQNLISMLQRLKKTTYKEDTSSGFFDSNESNSSNASPKSNSPTISTMNLNFKDASDFFNSIKLKSKIESAL